MVVLLCRLRNGPSGYSLVPRLPSLFNTHEKRGKPGIQCHVHDVGPYTRVYRKGGGSWKLCVGKFNFQALLFDTGEKESYWQSARVVQSLEASRSYIWNTEDDKWVWNWRLGGEASMIPFCQRLSCDFGYQAFSRFFLQVKKAERGLGTRLSSYASGGGVCIRAEHIHDIVDHPNWKKDSAFNPILP